MRRTLPATHHREAAMPVDDDLKIQKDVMAELQYEPRVDAAAIGVAVLDGVVTLSGHVPSLAQKTAAEAAARRVKGVKALVEELEVNLAGDDDGDEAIAARVADLLSWTALPEPAAIEVVVADRWVTLSGDAPWDHQRQEAERAVRHLAGVRGVTNNIRVRPTLQADNVHELITRAFQRSADLEGAHVKVAVDGSTVTLTGRVKTWYEQEMAERAALAAPGVTQVVNQIQIG
jgi:osmotically-inducible protein OsmY